MEKFLREWRQDAVNKSQFDAAIFIADKLLALTNDAKDAFWLAQVHFNAGNYTRALTILSKQDDLLSSNPSCKYLMAHCMIKQSRFDEALQVLGEDNPTHLIPSAESRKHKRIRSGKGTAEPSEEKAEEEAASDRRYEAGNCHLRGVCYAKQNAFDRAKECYKDAVRIDVQCFEAFSELMKNHLMAPDEEDEFFKCLDFDSIKAEGGDPSMDNEAGDYAQMLYATQLSKYRDPRAFKSAVEQLETHYGLEDNPDLLHAQADLLYTQCRFREALAMTDDILGQDRYNFTVYPLHLACLYELKMKNPLFLIAHELADMHPEQPVTYLAIGIYYFAVDRISEARRFFSKASMMDASFMPAWIGFAHTFAAEGEHDQAVSAYSTAARLFMGNHLPQVFLAMQHHAMNNMTAANEFLRTAYTLCKRDPLLLNEMGIVFYHQDKLDNAAQCFTAALQVADHIDSDPQAWLGARTNLGHALRRLGKLEKALREFDTVLREGGKKAAVFCAKGLVLLELDRPDEAVAVLHQALAINPQDPIATELLNKALDESVSYLGLAPGGRGEDKKLDEFEAELVQHKADAKGRMAASRAHQGSSGTTTATGPDKGGVGFRRRDKGKIKDVDSGAGVSINRQAPYIFAPEESCSRLASEDEEEDMVGSMMDITDA